MTEIAAREAIVEEYAERRCVRCGEWWPADEEFFYRLSDGRLHSYCRVCCTERKAELRRGARRLIIRPAGISGARRG